MIREHAHDATHGRRLFSLGLAQPSALPPLDLPSDRFACLLAWDARAASTDDVTNLVEPMLRAGASYFLCWGPGCERVHDIVDDIAPDGPGTVLTTWHAEESLREALWFLLTCTMPDDRFRDSTRATLALSVGSADWDAEIVAALENPGEFVARGSDG